MQSALTPFILESGGKDSAIIRHDAKLDQTIILLKRVLNNIKLMRVGCSLNDEDKVDIGAITTNLSQGAILPHGGHVHNHPNYPKAQYYTPTLLT
ncbi:4482_t:CDS:2, partial [Diversispora eburnea]